EICAGLAHKVACGPDLVEVLDESRARALAVRGDGAGHFGDRAAVAGDRFEELDDACLAFALEHAVDRALAVFKNGRGGEGGAVAANPNDNACQAVFPTPGPVHTHRASCPG